MASILKYDGVDVDRRSMRTVLDRLTLAVGDGYDTLEFSQVAQRIAGDFTARKSCELIVDGVTRFKGVTVSTHYGSIGTGPIRIGYRAFGLEWLANRIRVTGADGTGRILYNLPRTDPDYIPINSALSVGEILERLFDLHSTQLAAIGVVGYDAGDLADLVVVPPEPVYLSGGLWGAARALLCQWCNKYVPWIDPADGVIRIRSQLGGLTPIDLQLDTDSFMIDSLSRDHSECATKWVSRGAGDVQAAYLDFHDEGLAKGYDDADPWTLADYLQPRDGADLGGVTAQSSTTLTVSSDEGARFWASNFWSGLNAEVVAYNSTATDITFSESRRIVSNTALTAGGSSVLTVDEPFSNTGYDRYSIRGAYSASALKYRKILVNNPFVAQRLVKRFSHSVPWSPIDGATTQTTSPQASLCYSPTCAKPWWEFPASFDVVPFDGTADGYLVFHEPIVKPFSSRTSLEAGTPDGVPCDVKVLVPYSRGALEAVAPASGFEGTAYTVDGVEQVHYGEVPSWRDYRDRAQLEQLAREQLDCVKNTVVEGSLTYFGKLSAALTKGLALSINHPDYDTGLESMGALVRSVVLDFAPDGGSATEWTTRLSFSNRMKPFGGDRLYVHPAYSSAGAIRGASLDLRAAGASIGATIEQSAPRPVGQGADVELDMSRDRNRYRGPRNDKGLDAQGLRGALGKDAGRNQVEADGRESERRANASASERSAKGLHRAKGFDMDTNVRHSGEAQAAKAKAEKGSAASASRLSHAKGNPTGPKALQADREIDAELARLADEDEGAKRPGSTGGAIAYP